LAKDRASAEIIKPLAVGDDVRRWRIQAGNRWVVFARRGIQIDDYPAVKTHLMLWKTQLMPRKAGENIQGRKPGRYKWYEIQDEVAYFEAFERPKIIFPDICKEARFTFDREKYYIDATASCIGVDDIYLLGILNSAPTWRYMCEKFAVLGDAQKGGRMRLKSFYVEQIPIPDASSAERAAITALVQKCLDAKGIGCEKWEAEINERVAALYGL